MSTKPLFPATKEGLLRHAEYLYLLEILEKFPEDILAYVADSYHYFGFLTQILPLAKDIIMSRNGKLVIRGDSGDPVEIICGIEVPDYSSEAALSSAAFSAFSKTFDVELCSSIDTSTFNPDIDYIEEDVTSIFKFENQIYKGTYTVLYNEEGMFQSWDCKTTEKYVLTPEEKGTIEILYDIFGGTVNPLGYKVLDEHIGMIYGDGITMERAQEIFKRLKYKGFASTNVVFGIGAYSLAAMLSRDDLGIAVKATAATVEINGKDQLVPVYKEPKTDSSKKSAKGLLKVTYNNDTKMYELQDDVTPEEELEGELQTVFINGKFTNLISLQEVKQRLYG